MSTLPSTLILIFPSYRAIRISTLNANALRYSPGNMAAETPLELVTSAQASLELGYTIQHTRLLIRTGKLSATKLGRDWIISRAEVRRYQLENRREAAPHG